MQVYAPNYLGTKTEKWNFILCEPNSNQVTSHLITSCEDTLTGAHCMGELAPHMIRCHYCGSARLVMRCLSIFCSNQRVRPPERDVQGCQAIACCHLGLGPICTSNYPVLPLSSFISAPAMLVHSLTWGLNNNRTRIRCDVKRSFLQPGASRHLHFLTILRLHSLSPTICTKH